MASSMPLGHKCCCSLEPVCSSVTRSDSPARRKAQSWKAETLMLLWSMLSPGCQVQILTPFSGHWMGGGWRWHLLTAPGSLCAAVEFQEPSEAMSPSPVISLATIWKPLSEDCFYHTFTLPDLTSTLISGLKAFLSL